MLSRSATLNLIHGKGVSPVGGIVQDPDRDHAYLAFVKLERDSRGGLKPTRSKLDAAAQAVQDSGGQVKFILTDAKAAEVEVAVKTMLAEKFPGETEAIVLSVSGTKVIAWLELQQGVNDQIIGNITSSIEELLSYLGFSLLELVTSSSLNLPTLTTCLSSLRKHSPLTQSELLDRLINAGFDTPSEKWLSNALDGFRRHGLIHRRSDLRFILTLKGLNTLGTGRDRMSPDVSRALAMNRG